MIEDTIREVLEQAVFAWGRKNGPFTGDRAPPFFQLEDLVAAGVSEAVAKNLVATRSDVRVYGSFFELAPLAHPIAMRLFCERCHAQHIDKGHFATHPHHTHTCQACGLTWRPAREFTVGVQFIPGFKDPEP